MKTFSLPLLLVLSAVGAFASPPASVVTPAQPAATAYRVKAIAPAGRPNVEAGVSERNVKLYIGSPDATLSDGSWVYHDFNPVNKQAGKDGCGTVLISFKDGRVSDIRGVNAPALRLITTRLAAGEAASKIAASH